MKNKKFFSAFIAIMTILCFTVSCSNAKNELQNSEKSEESEEKEIIVNCGEVISLTIEDYDEYENFIYENKLPESYSFYNESYEKICEKNGGLPENFVTYDKISHIGAFDSFIYLSNVISGDNSRYMYTLIDENGYNVSIKFKLNDDKPSEAENILITENINDFRNLSSEISGCVFVDDVEYTYVLGKLLSIKKVYEDITVTITGASVLSDYPTDREETFISRLLDPDTASVAISEFGSFVVTE